MYRNIFFTNVLRLLDERQMTKKELSERSGVSISFLSDLTTGKGNPSLKIMEDIANALHTPLPVLLTNTDLDRHAMSTLTEGKKISDLPDGFEFCSAVLLSIHAFEMRRYAEIARKQLAARLPNGPT